jgi:hypothetical protein
LCSCVGFRHEAIVIKLIIGIRWIEENVLKTEKTPHILSYKHIPIEKELEKPMSGLFSNFSHSPVASVIFMALK